MLNRTLKLFNHRNSKETEEQDQKIKPKKPSTKFVNDNKDDDSKDISEKKEIKDDDQKDSDAQDKDKP